MSKEITNEQVLSAVTELITSQSKLEKKIDSIKTELKTDIAKVDKKVDLVDRKFSIITESQLTQQADIRELQNVNNLL